MAVSFTIILLKEYHASVLKILNHDKLMVALYIYSTKIYHFVHSPHVK